MNGPYSEEDTEAQAGSGAWGTYQPSSKLWNPDLSLPGSHCGVPSPKPLPQPQGEERSTGTLKKSWAQPSGASGLGRLGSAPGQVPTNPVPQGKGWGAGRGCGLKIPRDPSQLMDGTR